jgi:hypothetical protein
VLTSPDNNDKENPENYDTKSFHQHLCPQQQLHSPRTWGAAANPTLPPGAGARALAAREGRAQASCARTKHTRSPHEASALLAQRVLKLLLNHVLPRRAAERRREAPRAGRMHGVDRGQRGSPLLRHPPVECNLGEGRDVSA